MSALALSSALLGCTVLGAWIQRRLQSRFAQISHSPLRVTELRTLSKAAHVNRLALSGTLAVGAAHEMRSPLSVLFMALEEIEACGIDPELVEDLRDAAQAMRLRIEDMTGFARRHNEESICAPREAVERALRMASPKTRQDITVRCLLPELSLVAMDRGRLSQVLLNLVINAVDATGREGRIDVWGREDGEAVYVCVEDNGPGVLGAQVDLLFSPFHTTKEEGAGTGLGLWLCQRLVEEAGGSIEVSTGRLGGACFAIRLPRVESWESAQISAVA